MLENLITNYSYIGIFIIAFLASSLIPLSSDVFVVLMISVGYNPIFVFIFATAGNFLGSLLNYFIGKSGRHYSDKKHIIHTQKNVKRLKKTQNIFKKYGGPVLFFSWVPIIGDPLCLVAGILNYDLKKFSIWVLLGKMFRYAVLILATLGVIRIF